MQNVSKLKYGDPKNWDISVGDWIDDLAIRFKENPAIVCHMHSSHGGGTVRWSFPELVHQVHTMQHLFARLGITKGDRVAVLLANSPEWLVSFLALMRMGAVMVPINPRYGSTEIAAVLAKSKSCCLISMATFLGRDYSFSIADAISIHKPGVENVTNPFLRDIISTYGQVHPHAKDMQTLKNDAANQLIIHGAPALVDDPSLAAIMLFTSGTTSGPKAVQLTHRNILRHSLNCIDLMELEPKDVAASLLPFHGVSGGINKPLSTLGAGACIVFQESFNATEAAKILTQESCTVIYALDVQIREIISALQIETISTNVASVRRRGTITFMTGQDDTLVESMRNALGIERFINGYGTTEVNSLVLRNSLNHCTLDSLLPGGLPAPDMQVRVVQPGTSNDVQDGELGEIIVRGPATSIAYVDDVQATSSAYRDSWFHTGDLGERRSDGFITLKARMGDILKVGGYKITPQEVEQFLRRHPSVADVAVTSMQDDRLGEVPVALVVAKSGTEALQKFDATMKAWCKGKIANFKTPRHFWIVEKLPYQVGGNGQKLLRKELPQLAVALYSASISHHIIPN